jgi:hypothetical protein
MRNSIRRCGGQLSIPGSEILLDSHGALYRLHHTSEFCQQVVPRGVDDSSPVLLDKAGHDLPVGCQRADGRRLILAHQTAIAFDIGTEDRCQLAFHTYTLLELTGV